MKTPIADFVKNYAEGNFSRLHMPGHKGKGFLGIEKYDITEIDGADVLYQADGIIRESRLNASRLFGSAATFYSTEGSSLCIKAMLSLVCTGKKERPLILAARNAHKAFIYAAALLDFDVRWMYSKNNGHLSACLLTPDEVEQYIISCKKTPDAVYITSPDYSGNLADIKGISEVCDKYDIPLLADNAHGAYLAFLEEKLHPISLGAAMCCDSAHKTLPVLTGGAYLHIGEKGRKYIPYAEDCLSLHASTSPSYLILQSLDLCNAYLDNGYREKLSKAVKRTAALINELESLGLEVKGNEPLKITISALSKGYTGKEIGEHLYKKGVVCEFCDRDIAVMMPSAETGEEDFEKISEAFRELPDKNKALKPTCDTLVPGEQRLSVRRAIFAESQWISVDEASGRICASPSVSCPPAIPISVSGELITDRTVSAFKAYGIEKIQVVKK